MSQFEYIAVLVSVIAGLGIVHLLSGITRFLSTKGPWKPYWVHLLWTWNVFHFIVFYWWFFWRWSAISDWQLLLFLFILVYAVLLYMLCAILFPPNEKKTDFREIYYQNRKYFFGLWVLIMLIDIGDTQLKIYHGLSGFGSYHIFMYLALITGSILAARSSNHRFHIAWGFTFFGIMSGFEYLNFSVLRAD